MTIYCGDHETWKDDWQCKCKRNMETILEEIWRQFLKKYGKNGGVVPMKGGKMTGEEGGGNAKSAV